MKSDAGSHDPRQLRAEVVTVGDEVLAGATIDTNSGFIARSLFGLGVAVGRVTQVPDSRRDIQEAVAAALGRARYVVVTGGLGPTPDDHTKEDLAALFGDPLELDETVLEGIRRRFAERNLEMPDNNIKQAMLPAGGSVLANPVGSAPGVYWRRDLGGGSDGHVFVLPGVPAEMEAMLRQEVLPRVQQLVGSRVRWRLALFRTTGRPESDVAARLHATMEAADCDWAFYPSLLGVDVLLRGPTDDAPGEQGWDATLAAVRRVLGHTVYTEEAGVGLEVIVGRLLLGAGATLAVAESCTGGLLGKRLTDAPGSSAYFLGGFVTYDNAAKRNWAGVPADVLDRHGAVSAPVALAMARGVQQQAGTTYGLGITGVAGPTGGTAEKPVGLVYVALAAPGRQWTRRLQLGRRRDFNREQSAQAALDMLRRALLDLPVGDEA